MTYEEIAAIIRQELDKDIAAREKRALYNKKLLKNAKAAYLVAKITLDQLPDFPVRVDEMTEREQEIAKVACMLCGSMKTIMDLLEPET